MATLRLHGPDNRHGARRKPEMRTYVWYIEDKQKEEGGRWRTIERSTGCVLGERAEAERKLGEYLIAKRDPRPSGPRDPAAFPIADALSLYMMEHAPHVTAPDRIGYAVTKLLPFWGGQMVGAITGNTCRAYAKQRKASAATARRELGVLAAAVRHCEREGYLTSAPAVVLPEVQPPKHRVYTRRELAQIIRSARMEPRCRDYLPLFILLGAYTGKRSAAIRHLQWVPNTSGDGWVDVDAGMIHWGYSGTKKRRGEPTPIPAPLLCILRRRARTGRGLARYVLDTPWSRGKASGPFKTAWRAALIRAGVVPHGRMHDLRHTAASTLLCKGVPDWLAAQYLGMSVDTLRRTYAHLIPGALLPAAAAVGGK